MSRIFQTYPMLELSRKVFTTEILYLTFTFKKKKKFKSIFIRSKIVESKQT